ncbi:MAG: alpha/beta hydrolase [Sediminibacterium sp.]|jgi:pimeloyl-ACP methyl ester carboxylesterase|nr:alpha/beta hydrolase [Sediminibacterium sp.]
MATYFFEFDNRQMGYQKTGTGPAVILLHGFGEDHSIFNSTVTALEKNYTVYTPDLPGTGMSSINSNEYPANFSIEYLADSVAALTHHEKINNCTLLGHSMGGYTTMAFANKYPGYLNAFGLLHSTALPDTPLKIENRTRGISFIEKMGAASFLETTVPNLFGSHTKETNPIVVADFIKALPDFSNEALIAYYHAMMARQNLIDVLASTNVPVLFVLGDQDIAVALEDTLPQTKMPNTAYLYVLENCGHMGMLEHPTLFNNAVLDFLDKVNA